MNRLINRIALGILSFLLVSLVFWSENIKDSNDIGYLSLNPGNSSIYFDKYDTTIMGDEIDGATYFFIPSYIELSALDYSRSELKLYREDGTILQKPRINTVENVVVGGDNQELIQYRVGFYCSENLATMEIEMQDQSIDEISRETYSQAKINVRTSDGRVKYSSKQSLIKGRGNITWGLEKKPYDIRLSKKLSIAGMEASDKWTLLADNLDPVHLRNKVAFDVAGMLDMEYVTESDWVDLYIDNRYIGNYLLCHEVSDAPGGGILLEQNETSLKKGRYTWSLPSGITITIKSPDDEDLTERKKYEIKEYTVVVDDAIMNHLPEAQYEVIDQYSFARRYLVDEISLNADLDFSSHFYYKKPGYEKLYAGPCWDFDKSFGYNRPGRRDWNNTILSLNPSYIRWDLSLASDEEYQDYVRQTFESYYPALDMRLFSHIDEYYDRIQASLEMDRIKWGRGPERLFRDSHNDIRYLKFFLDKRLQYLSKCYGISSECDNNVLSKDSLHYITLRIEDGEESVLAVQDGTLLKEEDLPEYDKSVYTGWVFDFDGRYEEVSGFIPVYEDLDLILETK